jgi:hypothetical protein
MERMASHVESCVLTEINKESRQNLGVREELIIRNYGFINPLAIDASDPRYVSALRIAIVQLEMVQAALEQGFAQVKRGGDLVTLN